MEFNNNSNINTNKSGLDDQSDNITIATNNSTCCANSINSLDYKLIDELNAESQVISGQITELVNDLKHSMSEFSGITLQSMECYHEAQVNLNENLLKALDLNLRLIEKGEGLDSQFSQLEVIKAKIKSIKGNLDQLEYLLK